MIEEARGQVPYEPGNTHTHTARTHAHRTHTRTPHARTPHAHRTHAHANRARTRAHTHAHAHTHTVIVSVCARISPSVFCSPPRSPPPPAPYPSHPSSCPLPLLPPFLQRSLDHDEQADGHDEQEVTVGNRRSPLNGTEPLLLLRSRHTGGTRDHGLKVGLAVEGLGTIMARSIDVHASNCKRSSRPDNTKKKYLKNLEEILPRPFKKHVNR